MSTMLKSASCESNLETSTGKWPVKNLGNDWSKSIVLENKVFLNFDLRHGAPVAKVWPNIFQNISIYFRKNWFALVCHQLDQKQKYFR